MKLARICMLCIALGGCATNHARQEEIAARNAAKDDEKCQSYGAKPGTPGYIQCRTQLDTARTTAAAVPSTCITSGNTTNCF